MSLFVVYRVLSKLQALAALNPELCMVFMRRPRALTPRASDVGLRGFRGLGFRGEEVQIVESFVGLGFSTVRGLGLRWWRVYVLEGLTVWNVDRFKHLNTKPLNSRPCM